MIYIVLAVLVFLFCSSPLFRCAIFHAVSMFKYLGKDSITRVKYKKDNDFKSGSLNIYCGYFGSGKTLSLVHKVTSIYHQYNGLTVWCPERKKFVTQRILILSNVDLLSVPYVPLESLAQVVAASDANKVYDQQYNTLTCTIVCMDELSVQMNSREFAKNIDAYFLNTLMCCRHYHVTFFGSAQRFAHVDKLMRDVTMNVVQCRKLWRFQLNTYYDAWQLENATNPEMIKPVFRRCWFVRDSDYEAYDTLSVVQNLQKKYSSGDIFTEAEILARQSPSDANMDVVSTPSRKYRKRVKSAKH